ncbi:hypothetical protein [Candidatus Enterovibrio escicola]|uniref:hypothetical protein n=1 Tax=Candidatus Enterovibrio escicola TaxID=1927127 RepID=UPI0016800B50|nr:hypothetical protein [Candidatus Enterovibrio escacola]
MLQAIEAEVQSLLDNSTSLQANGNRGVVRHGHLPERHLYTRFVNITVKVPKVRDSTCLKPH